MVDRVRQGWSVSRRGCWEGCLEEEVARGELSDLMGTGNKQRDDGVLAPSTW